MRLSEYFGLGKSQAELDFVDIPIETDIALWVDPYALSLEKGSWIDDCNLNVTTYFQSVIDAIGRGDRTEAVRFLGNLREPNEVHLGLSAGRPSGRGVGQGQAEALYDRLARSRAVATGNLNDLEDAELVIPGIGPDKISDITINVIRANLAEYTAQQAQIHQIPINIQPLPPVWDRQASRWQSKRFPLPGVNGRPILLVPKALVRRKILVNHDDFYDDIMTDMLVAEHEDAAANLAYQLRQPPRRITKTEVRREHPKTKDTIFDFTQSHAGAVPAYKAELAALDRPMTNNDIESINGEPRPLKDPLELIEELTEIPRGSAGATNYHRKVVDVMEAIFYPQLGFPRIEAEIHDGRKRIDFTFSPIIQAKGFFAALQTQYRVHAPLIMCEAKNYTSDIGNDELDQLLGRFTDLRGKFGIIVLRNADDPEMLARRCKDAAIRGQGIIITLTDQDLKELAVAWHGGQAAVDRILQRRMEELLRA